MGKTVAGCCRTKKLCRSQGMCYRVYVIGIVVVLLIVSLGATASTQAQVELTPGGHATAPPTNTKRPTRVVTATPTPVAIPARLCADCTRVRLRASPGTAGDVVDFLDSSAELLILGRSSDSTWLYVKVSG